MLSRLKMSQVCAEHALSCPVLGVPCLALPSLYSFCSKGCPVMFCLNLFCSVLFHCDLPSPMLCTLPGTDRHAVKAQGKHLGWCTWSIRQPACTVCVPVLWTVRFWCRLTVCHGAWAGICFHACSLVTVACNLSLVTNQSPISHQSVTKQ